MYSSNGNCFGLVFGFFCLGFIVIVFNSLNSNGGRARVDVHQNHKLNVVGAIPTTATSSELA